PAGVHTLRTLDDALALRAALERARSLLVIGGGFIGSEVAGAARERGIDVTVLEAAPVPSTRALGPQLGALCGRLLTDAGVDLRTGVTISHFLDAGSCAAVELADGTRVEADAAIVGIGGVPQLDWLADTGLDLADGLACDPTGRVHGLDGVWAVGDVAAWDDLAPGNDGHHPARRRHEHWTGAGDQAAVVARDILGAAPRTAAVPYFWSDQFGTKIQLFGRPELADAVVALHGDGLSGGAIPGTIAGYLAGDRLTAVVGFGAARRVTRYRALVARGADRAETLRTAARLA
ncbi:MAG: NAD(P)/FAD-dependent oxidoreductase, partial [Pseudonocardia sp.]